MNPNLPPTLGDMPIDEFREHGHQLIEWIADYLQNPSAYPVLSRTRPGEIKAQLPSSPPVAPEEMAAIWQDFEQIILPGVTHWNHPNFFAYFSTSSSAPAILAELLMAALNVNAMLWRTSPSATELEEVALDWLRQMLGLTADFSGVIMDTASVSSMVAIAAARESLNLAIREQGMAGRTDLPRLRLYVSDQTHSSVEKGAITLGIGQENVVKIGTDEAFQMRPDLLQAAIEVDLAQGYRPFFVCATVGTTSTTSIDPVTAVADLAQKYNLWLHVDGAYGGMAAVAPQMRHVLAGAERADSLVVNPHKWLFVPLDLSAFYTRHPHIIKQAFSLVPEYLRTAEGDSDAVTNFMDYGVQLGRRFRALKLWFVIRHFGAEGIGARLWQHIQLGQLLAGWIDESAEFERLAPTPFSTVCFRAHPSGWTDEASLNELNQRLLEAINATGEIYISHTVLRGQYSLRLAIGNIRTEEAHITRAWQLLGETLKSVIANP